MGHYDTCRPGNCPACGQALGVVWPCGRRHCSTYHKWLQENSPAKYTRLIKELENERANEEEIRVTARQVKRRTLQIAAEAKKETEK